MPSGIRNSCVIVACAWRALHAGDGESGGREEALADNDAYAYFFSRSSHVELPPPAAEHWPMECGAEFGAECGSD